ncbi:MAG: lysophospholipid acyltransferase family protein [Gaiella sp.]
MNVADLTWGIGRPTLGLAATLASRLQVYGRERVPRNGGLVIAANHFHWLDPVVLGAASPRVVYYMAKIEAHRMPGLGAAIRAFGCFPVRRGESDRDAVRTMRRIVAEGHALGLFVEGSRQLSGVPGLVQPGAAMVAVQERVPVVPVAIHGSLGWKPGNFKPVSIAWGEPIEFTDLPRGGKGYKQASARIQSEIRALWEWLVELHDVGRPRTGTPPAAEYLGNR